MGEEQRDVVKRETVARSLRFADAFPQHEHAAAVLGAAADDPYAMKDYRPAITAAQRVIDVYPGADLAIRRSAWIVVAHGSFDLAEYPQAERAYAQLQGPRQHQVCARLFKALTDKATDVRGVRRPTRLGSLCGLIHATADEITAAVDLFRKPSRSFLMPQAGEPLAADTVIDIAHESLMRVWPPS